MNQKGILEGWGDALVYVAIILAVLCFLAAFPGGGKAALEAILGGVRCLLGACAAL